ncbi:Phage protein 13 [Amycolatopsis japonica]|uniref:Phage protein 13 n=1 Tax=Amycolatopsis japonica TaxID=208439 RepID=A0A075UZQ3_9PSEU|nr:hypothetical protein [Amycolatopsis japonica]AIG78458.1 Phage protein 13 [Amycolatopsis japonica]
MNAQEYADRQAGITRALIALVLQLVGIFRAPKLSRRDWGNLLAALYPHVDDARRQAAELGREFFDSQREQHLPDLPRHNTLLPAYHPEWFAEAMEPARLALSRPGAPEEAAAQVALRAAKEVENGGRRAILRAVDADPVVRGWARVATGRETCGWCMMLVSRGPVYTSADAAGLDLNDTSAAELWQKAESGDLESRDVIDELMTRWHPGCDCKVVPVFKISDWPGRDAWKRAEDAWKKYTKGYGGLDALNAFRRAVESGELDVRDFSIAA